MVVNHTPFGADVVAGWDHLGRPHVAVILVAAFELPPGGSARPCEERPALRPADVYHGEPGTSSVRYEADIALEKPRVDVLVNGSAVAPRGRRVERLDVGLRVADIDKKLKVTGDRPGGLIGGPPRAFESLPIVYERTLGGPAYGPNPVGIGHRGAAAASGGIATAAPNIEYADGRREPACFGVVARHWRPRVALAGTYDDTWRQERWPLLPTDFDPAYHQAAPADQQSTVLRGGEEVDVSGMTPDGSWRFRLPLLRVPVHLGYADRCERAALRLDTVLIEPDSFRVTLTARAKVPLERGRAPLREVVLGHVTFGWLAARRAAKPYRDPLGTRGKDAGVPVFDA